MSQAKGTARTNTQRYEPENHPTDRLRPDWKGFQFYIKFRLSLKGNDFRQGSGDNVEDDWDSGRLEARSITRPQQQPK